MDNATATMTSSNLSELVADIVSAYVSHNSVATGDLPGIISQVHNALQQTTQGGQKSEEPSKEPAVPIRRSVQPDHIVCLEDGKKFKSLKRHLRTEHDMTPQEYRAKWGLKPDYPMVAPNYAQTRSDMARRIGLGRKRAEARAAQQPKRRAGRPRKQAAE
jgi:predicted transcriptional regulator